MVKVDSKRDYYAELDLPTTADTEAIKKRFRELAKQYHPDRNPGREVDVVPKFQAIQAAHEVLGDPAQRAKYDTERAKLSRAREVESPTPTPTPTFRKPAPRRTDSAYPNGTFAQPSPQQQQQQQPPLPRRDPNANRYAPQHPPKPRPQSTSTADKFAQFARSANQQWDRNRYEENARAEGLRGMNAMRGGQAPQTSPMRSRHPTAPKSAGVDPYNSGPDPTPGFPGLNRTSSQRRGFNPNSPGTDDPRSAYAHFHRSDRERPPSASPYTNHPDPNSQPRDSESPLRQTRSFQPGDSTQMRPPLSRTSSKYATTGGDRTHLSTGNLGRSASVRTSPVDKSWEERGAFGNRTPAESRSPRPRPRSHSPQARPKSPRFDYTSESSTSEDDDDIPPPQQRKKASLRRPYTHAPTTATAGLTGYFPSTNYTRIVDDSNTYNYPAPELRGYPTRRPFPNLTSPLDAHDPNINEPSYRTSSQEDVPRHKAQSDESTRGKENSQFPAEEWHEHFDNHADLFKPPESTSRDRKSPTKGTRNFRPGQSRSFVSTKDDRRGAADYDIDADLVAGVRHINPEDPDEKASAFQSGRLAPDFADKVQRSRRGSHTTTAEKQPKYSDEPTQGASYRNGDQSTTDEMELDSPATSDTGPHVRFEHPYHVSVEEERSPPSTVDEPPSRGTVHRTHSNSTSQSNGLDLNDLQQPGLFTSPDTGLKDLNDLAGSLPFQSRPAESLAALYRMRSSSLRELNLPRPPKIPYPPADHEISQDVWRRYGDAMTTYMYDWTKFNAAMIEHFRARQEAVTHGMYRNWVCAHGDGATAEDFEASHGSDKAGFATYMTWLEDDRKCRTWWDVAFEDHRVCMEGLGRVRRTVKDMNAKVEA